MLIIAVVADAVVAADAADAADAIVAVVAVGDKRIGIVALQSVPIAHRSAGQAVDAHGQPQHVWRRSKDKASVC
jgi:hypothetical protein